MLGVWCGVGCVIIGRWIKVVMWVRWIRGSIIRCVIRYITWYIVVGTIGIRVG